MTVSCTLILDTDVLEAVQAAAKNSPRAVDALVNKSIRGDVERKALQLFSQESFYPGPVRIPFKFATPKSRRYYFWKFKGKIPYQRTGGMGRAWRVEMRNNEMVLVNDATGSEYVIGERQVPGHRNTGWRQFDQSDEFVDLSIFAQNMLIEGWYSIAEFEGVLP